MNTGAAIGTLIWAVILAAWGTYSLMLYFRKTWGIATRQAIGSAPVIGILFRYRPAYLIFGLLFWFAALWQLSTVY
jgi:hypothetical protein